MKRLLKILGAVLGIVLLGIIAFALWVHFTGIPTYENHAPEDYQVEMDSASIANGAKLATMLCQSCHGSKDRLLGGNEMADAASFGKIYAPNISQHPESKLAGYTNGELAYLIRTGVKRDGKYSPPYMVKMPHMSEEDLKDVIAFLRSDHPMMAPTDHQVPACEPNFLTKFLTKVAFGPLPYPEEPVAEPDTSDAVAWGRYLTVGRYDCYNCHSADFKTNDAMIPESSVGYMAGGNPLPDREGNVILSPNLTMDKETGIGNYSEEDFIKAVRMGIRPDKPACQYPMMPYVQMTDKEAAAIFAYIQSLDPVRNEKLLSSR